MAGIVTDQEQADDGAGDHQCAKELDQDARRQQGHCAAGEEYADVQGEQAQRAKQ